ncbi:hypothetical protein FDUTEX481_01781 [Tolypothrix sp. PCC 7601]|nr:hypothetical protein FDUTEX481_01781 [Tolypothrix sp. PCC 7601]
MFRTQLLSANFLGTRFNIAASDRNSLPRSFSKPHPLSFKGYKKTRAAKLTGEIELLEKPSQPANTT